MANIKISNKYGVNPAVPLCYYCNEPKNEVILAGRLPKDIEAPHNMVWDARPCDQCQKYMQMGIILISVRDGEEEEMAREQAVWENTTAWPGQWKGRPKPSYVPNPYRTGGWIVVKDDAVRRMPLKPEMIEQIIKARMCFLPDTFWDAYKLPRGAVGG